MDDLTKHTTKDGSLSLYSLNYGEGFHDREGALKESINKYLLPAQLDQLPNTQKIVVLDGTVGQNALSQLKNFDESIGVTGIIVTKLDGTAKGGILLAIGKKFKLPIVALGMGEKEDDLQTFNSEYFSNALMQF